MAGRERVLTGGCQCGAVRYALHAPPVKASICHCRMCQKAFGSYFAPLAGVKLADFQWTRGEPGIFMSSDAVERGFCRDCGTPLSFRYVAEDMIDVALGSLDDPSAVPPIIAYGIESRMPWFDTLPGLPGQVTSDDPPPTRDGRIQNRQHPDHDTD
jgi:hypothetical protein